MPRKGRFVKNDIGDEHSKGDISTGLQEMSPTKVRCLRSRAIPEVKQSKPYVSKPKKEQRGTKTRGSNTSTSDTTTHSQQQTPVKRRPPSRALPKVKQSQNEPSGLLPRKGQRGKKDTRDDILTDLQRRSLLRRPHPLNVLQGAKQSHNKHSNGGEMKENEVVEKVPNKSRRMSKTVVAGQKQLTISKRKTASKEVKPSLAKVSAQTSANVSKNGKFQSKGGSGGKSKESGRIKKESGRIKSKCGRLAQISENRMVSTDSGNSKKTGGFESIAEGVGFDSVAETTGSENKTVCISKIPRKVTKDSGIKEQKEHIKYLDKTVSASGTSEQVQSRTGDGDDHPAKSTCIINDVHDLSQTQNPNCRKVYYFPCYHSDDETINRFPCGKTLNELGVNKSEETKPKISDFMEKGQTVSAWNTADGESISLGDSSQDLVKSEPSTSNSNDVKVSKIKRGLEHAGSLPLGRKRRIPKRETKKESEDLGSVQDDISESSPKKKSRARVNIKEKGNMKIRPRTKKIPVADLELKKRMLKNTQTRKNKYIGAHVSISGSLCNAISDAVLLGARAFGMFLKSQRQWSSKPLEKEDAEIFKTYLKESDFSPAMVVPHGSYLMNCGSPVRETLEKSRAMLVDELKRCEMLGLEIFNFHPGSSCGEIPTEESICLIAESINIALAQTEHVTAVIENMSCQGYTVGGKFSELAAIIERVKDKSRVGVCLDTCHMFAAGYNIKTKDGYEKVMKEFDEIVGFKYLKAVHLNDSKGQLGCHRDLHANIGSGRIGIPAFQYLMNDQRFDNIPMILETPQVDYSKEIKLLNKLMEP